MGEVIAIIDTETNFSNKMISAGIVAVDSDTYKILDEYYGISDPEYKSYSMYGEVLKYPGVKIDNLASHKTIIADLRNFIDTNRVTRIFAYNAKFDYNLLVELQDYAWYDIMRLAAYKQYNQKISDCYECCKTGRLKSGFGVQEIYRMLSGECRYFEVHNALCDARDEMRIMQMMGKTLAEYEIACISR